MNERSAAASPQKQRLRPNGAQKRSTPAAARGTSSVLEPFAAVAIEPVDASMWPIHSGLWLQPDQPPALSGYGAEAARQHRFPAGDFAHPPIQPVDSAPRRETPVQSVLGSDRAVMPASDSALLGWDPRTLCPKEGIE